MEKEYAIVGTRRRVDGEGNVSRRKHFEAVTDDRDMAFNIVNYLNNTQTLYIYNVREIYKYSSLDEYIYFNKY